MVEPPARRANLRGVLFLLGAVLIGVGVIALNVFVAAQFCIAASGPGGPGDSFCRSDTGLFGIPVLVAGVLVVVVAFFVPKQR